jgi:alkylation response protein AidB-like acyl-CoA dehydrogenase
VTADLPVADVTGSKAAAGWEGAVAAGQVAIAHELVGACRTMLRLAREHALQREQFGRRIADFQAIRHRLAESLVALEGAQASVTAAWDPADVSSAPADALLAAALAKAVAGTAARTVGKHAQQVLGGMGYTTEHPLHRYVRRTLVLDQLLGSSRALLRDIGQHLLSTRALPNLLPL